MASILKLASKAASKSAAWAWNNSGASRVPVLDSTKNALVRKADKRGPALAPMKDEQQTVTPVKPETGDKSGWTAERRKMQADLIRQLKPHLSKGKDTVAENAKANERAIKSSQPEAPRGPDVAGITKKMEEDIHEIRELMEKQAAGAGGGAGGGILGSLLSSGALKKLAMKIPGVGKIIGALAGGAGIASIGKSVLGKVATAARGVPAKVGGLIEAAKARVAGASAKTARSGGLIEAAKAGGRTALGVGRSALGKVATAARGVPAMASSVIEAAKARSGGLVEAAKAGGRTALGVGRSAIEATGGLRAAAAAKLSTVAEKGSSIIEKAKGVATGSGAATAKLAGKSGLKSLIKKIPVIGLLAGVGFGVQRAIAGDWSGAGMEVASGIAGTVPGVGTAASLGLDAALAVKDSSSEKDPALEKISDQALGEPGAKAPLQPFNQVKPEVQSGLANLQAFVTAALDEKQGIFVRIAKNELTDDVNSSPIQKVSAPQTAAEAARGASNAPLGAMPPSNSMQVPQTAVSQERAKGAAQGVRPTSGQNQGSTPSAAWVGPTGAQERRSTPSSAQQGSSQTPGTPKERAKAEALGLRPAAPDSKEFKKLEPTTDLAKSELAKLIQRGEGDYDSYNAGTKGVDGGRVKHSGKKNLSEMTLNDIIKSSEEKTGNDKDRVFAAGRYQIITPTLKASMKKMGLKGDEKFTPELQDKIFQETLLPQSVRDYVGGKSEDVKGAQVDLAKVWRSFADPRTGKTYADAGAGANHASISAKESEAALAKTREQVMAAKKSDFKLAQPENRMSDTLKADTKEAKMAAGQDKATAPVVIPVPVASGSKSAAPSGGAGVGGHMGTRNDDSSIRRLTDAKMSYGYV